MGREIERKFLVTGEGWRAGVSGARELRQAYLARTGTMSVRVRILDGESARLTIKSAEAGLARAEYEYEVPVADAQEMLELRQGGLLEKTRHIVEIENARWEIDVFHGELEGLVVAEIELDREDAVVELPDWIGREVTGEAAYYNASLALHGLPRRNTGA